MRDQSVIAECGRGIGDERGGFGQRARQTDNGHLALHLGAPADRPAVLGSGVVLTPGQPLTLLAIFRSFGVKHRCLAHFSTIFPRQTTKNVAYMAEPQPKVLNRTSLMTLVSGSTLIWRRITSPHCHRTVSLVPTFIASKRTYSWCADQALADGRVGLVECSHVSGPRVVCDGLR